MSWYWAVPYIVALYIMKNLPSKTNRTYILYVAIAIIGLAFLAFMSLDRSVVSYLIVDTLMLSACITLIILPVLHKYLSGLLTDHAYLTVISELSPPELPAGKAGGF